MFFVLFILPDSISSILSGSLHPKVSGNHKQRKAPNNIVTAKIIGDTQLGTPDKVATNGATIEPNLENVEHDPEPTFRTKVGKTSPE